MRGTTLLSTKRGEGEGLWLRHSWREVAASGFSPLVKAPFYFYFFFSPRVTAQPLLASFLPSFKRGTVTRLLEPCRTTAGFAPAGLQGSEVVLNTLGPLQSRRLPPHYKNHSLGGEGTLEWHSY